MKSNFYGFKYLEKIGSNLEIKISNSIILKM